MTGFTHLARPLPVRENQLVDDDVVRVDAALGQLLDQPLRLIQGQELSDANTNEGGLFLQVRGKDYITGGNCGWSNLIDRINIYCMYCIYITIKVTVMIQNNRESHFKTIFVQVWAW